MAIPIIIEQMCYMALYMLCGYFLTKKSYLTLKGVQEISNILFIICTPLIMVHSFMIPFHIEEAKILLKLVIVSFLLLILSTIVSAVFFKDKKVEWFASTFSNAGFMGIPLVYGLLGSEGVFYITAFLVASNIYMWTLGIYKLSGRKELISIKQIVNSPSIRGLAVGLIFFLIPLEIPRVLTGAVYNITQINTVLAMMVLGHYIANTEITSILNTDTLKVSLVRLVVIPVLSIIMIRLLISDSLIRSTFIILVSAPSAVNTAILSMTFGENFEKGAGLVSGTTLLSVLSIPLMLYLSGL